MQVLCFSTYRTVPYCTVPHKDRPVGLFFCTKACKCGGGGGVTIVVVVVVVGSPPPTGTTMHKA